MVLYEIFANEPRIKIKEVLLYTLLIPLFIFFLPVIGSAAPIITIKPMFTVGGRLDSNFYKTENNEREVYTYFLRPGIQLGIQTAKSKINFNYTLDAYFYDDKSAVPAGERSADDENYIGHHAVLDARYPPTDRLTVGLNDYFYELGALTGMTILPTIPGGANIMSIV